MKRIRRFSLLILFVFSCTNRFFAQTIILPMDLPPSLSGNFGELRSNHFHSGLDFRTQGRTGIPVKTVKDGYVSRISISPYGYGKALYVNHPDETMTVYGHLERFAESIERMARDSQYVRESFSVDLDIPQEQIPVKQGDIIAYSGNTGSSGGPHLHFEIRNASGEEVMDPLPVYKRHITDTRPPEIRGLMFFPQLGKGIVNNQTTNQAFTLIADKSGKKILNKVVSAWGEIGVGVKAYDKMPGVENIYGVKEIILKVDDREVFHSCINRFSFAESRYINSFICWEDWVNNRSFHIKSFIEPGNLLSVFSTADNGIISIDEERIYRLEYNLLDADGNKTVFTFSVTGKKNPIPPLNKQGQLFLYNNENIFLSNGVELKIPKGNLYKNIYLKADTVERYSPFAPLYRINEKAPLHSYCSLILRITNDIYPDKSKYGVVSVNSKGRESWLGGTYENAKMRLSVRELGDYTIRIDTVPPVVTPVNQAKWKTAGKISFRIHDNLSGIASWHGTINGQFVLFEFDAKNNDLFYKYDYTRISKGRHQLELVVTDGCGNICRVADTLVE